MHAQRTAAAALLMLAGSALAQSVTIYGRLDLSAAQQADAPANKELRNGSGSRLGFKGSEDLGGGLKAFFHLEHRFNADDGSVTAGSRFWDGKSIVGLEGSLGRIGLGREENPAYTFSQGAADPWGTDTVASNGSIVNGRIGSTRYSNSVNYRYTGNGFAFGAQVSEAEGNVGAGGVPDDRAFSLGGRYEWRALTVGVGYEDPADKDDHWATVNASWDFGFAKVGGLFGRGRNALGEKHQAFLVTATAPVFGGELRGSYGELENKAMASDGLLDRQFGLGFHYPLSKRTTVYADLVHEKRDRFPGDRKSTGYDLGIKHNF